jgi:hypothetical protein
VPGRASENVALAAWVLTGAAAGFAVLAGLPVLGFRPLVPGLAAVAGAAGLLGWRPGRGRTAWGAVCGIGAVPLVLALRLSGQAAPSCRQSGQLEVCLSVHADDGLLVSVGLGLILVGATLYLWRRRRVQPEA